MLDFVTERRRDASGAIRGYVYQVDLTIERWLNLSPNAVLELERGEDVDTIHNVLQSPGEVQRQLLEQIKVRNQLTLRSPEAVDALASFYAHYRLNPTLDLQFRYVTTAEIRTEKKSPARNKKPLIELWNELRTSELANLQTVSIIRKFLKALRKPPKLATATWKQFKTFVGEASQDEVSAFIKRVEWLAGNTSPEDISKGLQEVLVVKYGVDLPRAQLMYFVLFVYVFKLLSQPGSKRLTAQVLEEVITVELSETDRQILTNINLYLSLDNRVSALEETVSSLSRAPLPSDEETDTLIAAYLKELANQPPYVNWSDETFVQRHVMESKAALWGMVKAYASNAKAETESQDLGAAVSLEKNLVLLGEPGLGKTTALLHLVWEAAVSQVSSKDTVGIPIHVELKNYEGESDLSELFAQKLNEILAVNNLALASDLQASARIVRHWLRTERLRFLLLLDGLNEVRQKHSVKLGELIRPLLRSPQRVIVSCREQDYDNSLIGLAKAVVLEKLQPAEILRYLQGRMGQDGTALFFDEIKFDAKMLTLAANPLMLSLIATIAETRRKESEVGLPQSRGELFNAFVAVMPRARRAAGFIPVVLPDVVIDAISLLAEKMQEQERLAMPPRDCRKLLEKKMATATVEQVLAQAKDWRFLKSDGAMGEPVEFLHPLFLEYFAAINICNELKLNRDYSKVINDRHLAEHWFEVLEMLAGIIEEPAEFLKWLCAEAVRHEKPETALLAYRCLSVSACSNEATITDFVVDALANTLDHAMLDTKGDIAWALGQLRNPKAADALIGELYDLSSESLYLLRKEAEDEADFKNLERIDLEYEQASILIVNALGRIGNLDAAPVLIELLLNPEEYPLVREQAALSLAMLKAKDAIEPLLRILRDRDSDYDLTNAAATALGRLRAKSAVEGLIEMFDQNDRDTAYILVKALGRIGDLRARDFLMNLRAEELSETTPDEDLIDQLDEALKNILAHRDWNPISALTDRDAAVRREAAIILGKEGDETALPSLRLLLHDQEQTLFGNVAEAAAEAIRQIEERELSKLHT